MRAQHRKARRTAPEAPQGLPAPFSLGPRWIAGAGAWEAGAAELAAWTQPLGLVGEAHLLKTHRLALTRAWLEAGVALDLLARPDGSDCDAAAVEAVAAAARARGLKGLIGFGGGRMLDLAKAAGARLGLPVATAPTSAATCACATAVAVLNEARAFREVLDVPVPVLCLVETPVLAGAPTRLLAAGLADTLAKWLEWSAVDPGPAAFGEAAGWSLARGAAATCEALGAEALAEPGGSAFEACLEAALLWSAAASNAGRAPAAAAHSLANALSRQAAGRGLLHGEAVGLGLLWQETLLNAAGAGNMEGGGVAGRLRAWNLPTALPAGLDAARLLADAALHDESLHLLDLDPALSGDPARLPLG